MYTLRFPFRLLSDREIEINGKTLAVGNLDYSLKREGQYYILTINGFVSEEQAIECIRNIRVGLYWLLLEKDISSEADTEIQKVTYAEDTSQSANIIELFKSNPDKPIDGLVDGSKPAIFPNNKHIGAINMGEATVTVSYPSNVIIEDLIEGGAYLKNPSFFKDKKLITAFDLYSAYFKETTGNAKFLTLVIALEVLTSPVERPTKILQLLEKWKSEAQNILQNTNLDKKEEDSLEAICHSLLYQKEESHRQNIRNLVTIALRKNGDNDFDEIAKKAVKLYDLRSDLVHDGTLEANILTQATSDAKNIVQRVLRAQFIQSACSYDDIQ